jgi:hypothetical protein
VIGVAMLAASLAIFAGVVWAVLWLPYDCGEVGCSQRANPWHSHPGSGDGLP